MKNKGVTSPPLNPLEIREAKLFTEEEIPWDEIAFRTVREALEHFFEDRRRGSFDRVHELSIV